MNRLRHKLGLSAICTVCVFIGCQTAFAAVTGTISGEAINIRGASSTSAEILQTVDTGQAVTVVGVEGDFYKLVLKSGKTAYVAKQFVTFSQPYGVVNSKDINIRQAPSTSAEILGRVNAGEYFAVSAKDGEWYAITFGGQKAYIHQQFLSGDTLANVKAAAAPAPIPEPAPTPSPAPEPAQNTVPAAPLVPDLPEDEAPAVISGEPQPVTVLSVDTAEPAPESAEQPEEYAPSDEETASGSDVAVPELEDEAEPDVTDVVPEASPAEEPMITYAVSTADTGLNLRGDASKEAERLAVIPSGDVMDVLEAAGEWIKVDYSGKIGYVSMEFVTVATGPKPQRLANPSKADEVVTYAKQFLGTPYVYGGNDLRGGVDCSGFVCAVMKNFGVNLNRSSAAMASNGYAISKEELLPGDLVFFAANGSHISHVAIYVGDGRYIHSTDAGGRGVSFGSLYDDYSARTYHSARRVIN